MEGGNCEGWEGGWMECSTTADRDGKFRRVCGVEGVRGDSLTLVDET